MRYSQVVRKTSGRPPYLSTVAVFTTEVAKLLGSFMAVVIEEGGIVAGSQAAVASFQVAPTELLRLTVPALLYAVQNNLLFIALANLTAAAFTVSYQLKTLTTALFSVLVLGRVLSRTQWMALSALSAGVALLQLPSSSAGPGQDSANMGVSMIGMGAVALASITSGFCGVYMEKLLKQNTVSLWLRNVQLALVGAPVSLLCAFVADYSRIQENGLLQGYDELVWGVVCINALGGLAIAAVLRYADNIVKCFATAIAVMVSCFLSNFMGELVISTNFIIGTSLVACASVLYGLGSSGGPLADLGDAAAKMCPTSGRARLTLLAVVTVVGTLCIVALGLASKQLETESPDVERERKIMESQ